MDSGPDAYIGKDCKKVQSERPLHGIEILEGSGKKYKQELLWTTPKSHDLHTFTSFDNIPISHKWKLLHYSSKITDRDFQS